jgi:hypothetical protein
LEKSVRERVARSARLLSRAFLERAVLSTREGVLRGFSLKLLLERYTVLLERFRLPVEGRLPLIGNSVASRAGAESEKSPSRIAALHSLLCVKPLDEPVILAFLRLCDSEEFWPSEYLATFFV